MTSRTKIMCGIILILIPTIQYGGFFLLQVLAGAHEDINLTPFQKSMFRAGHAHAGVLVLLCLIAQILVDYSGLSRSYEWTVRLGFPLSAILISGGFFGGALGNGITEPSALIWLLYVGTLLLTILLIVLGIGLIKHNSVN